jgi:hypothetical protein
MELIAYKKLKFYLGFKNKPYLPSRFLKVEDKYQFEKKIIQFNIFEEVTCIVLIN